MVQRVRVSVVIPSETIRKQKKKTERGRQLSLPQPRVAEPNRIRYRCEIGNARKKKEGKEHMHACTVHIVV